MEFRQQARSFFRGKTRPSQRNTQPQGGLFQGESQHQQTMSQRVATYISCSRVLGIDAFRVSRHPKKLVLVPSKSGRTQDQLTETTNVFAYFLGMCNNPNYIKACVSVDVADLNAQILVAINQGSHLENEAELQRAVEMIRRICRELANTRPGCECSTRDKILLIILHFAWAKICHRLGMVYSYGSNDKSAHENGGKDVKIPKFLPDRLDTIYADITQQKPNFDKNFLQAVQDLAKELRNLLPDKNCQATTNQSETNTFPDGTHVSDEKKLAALLAVHKFYDEHKDTLSRALSDIYNQKKNGDPAKSDDQEDKENSAKPDDQEDKKNAAKPDDQEDKENSSKPNHREVEFVSRLRSLSQYVEGVIFLINVVLGHVSSDCPSEPQDTGKIIDWFESVEVKPCMLPQEAFSREGSPTLSPQHTTAQTARPPPPPPPPPPPLQQLNAGRGRGRQSRSSRRTRERPPVSHPTTATSPPPPDCRLAVPAPWNDEPTLIGSLTQMGHVEIYRTFKIAMERGAKGAKKKQKASVADDNEAFLKEYRNGCRRFGPQKAKIHAEVSLAFVLVNVHASWRMEHPDDGGPDDPVLAFYIASSKIPCFTCDAFIRFCCPHIIPSPEHGAIYCAWCCPGTSFIQRHFPTASKWAEQFCDGYKRMIGERLHLFVEGKVKHDARQGTSEDIQLRKTGKFHDDAYSTKNWPRDPAAPAPAPSAGPSTARALTSKDKNQLLTPGAAQSKRPSSDPTHEHKRQKSA